MFNGEEENEAREDSPIPETKYRPPGQESGCDRDTGGLSVQDDPPQIYPICSISNSPQGTEEEVSLAQDQERTQAHQEHPARVSSIQGWEVIISSSEELLRKYERVRTKDSICNTRGQFAIRWMVTDEIIQVRLTTSIVPPSKGLEELTARMNYSTIYEKTTLKKNQFGEFGPI